MAIYQTDLEDIYFNLFELLKVDQTAAESSDLGADDIKEIIAQLDKFIGLSKFFLEQSGSPIRRFYQPYYSHLLQQQYRRSRP